ncbi:MAG: PilZ domain-containing protein [Myxococcales bacterium]
MPGKDKRRHSRVKPRGVVAHVRSADRTFACQVENLSAGGLFLRTDQFFPKGSRVEVDLVRPGARRPLRVAGRIVGTISPEEAVSQRFIPGLGVEFSELTEDDAKSLETLLGTLGVHPEEAKVQRNSQPPRAPAPPSAPPPIQRIYTPPPDLPKVPQPARTASRPTPPSGARVEAEAILRHIAEALDVDDSIVEERATPGYGSTLPRIAHAPIPTPTPIPAIARPPPRPLPTPASVPAQPSPDANPEAARLMMQIRGLLFELGEVQARLRTREAEIQDLRSQLDDMRRQIAELESRREA